MGELAKVICLTKYRRAKTETDFPEFLRRWDDIDMEPEEISLEESFWHSFYDED